MGRSLAPADHTDRIRCLGARQLLDHALAGPLPLLQEDQEIGQGDDRVTADTAHRHTSA
jgi:hypothetical protein